MESNNATNELNSKVTGSIIKSMSVANLKTLNIPYIPIEKQEDMKNLILLWEREKEIYKEILEEKGKLYNSYLEKMIIEGK